jgi:hypothetical protein
MSGKFFNVRFEVVEPLFSVEDVVEAVFSGNTEVAVFATGIKRKEGKMWGAVDFHVKTNVLRNAVKIWENLRVLDKSRAISVVFRKEGCIRAGLS